MCTSPPGATCACSWAVSEAVKTWISHMFLLFPDCPRERALKKKYQDQNSLSTCPIVPMNAFLLYRI